MTKTIRLRKFLNRLLRKLFLVIYDKPIPPLAASEEAFLSELRKTFREAPVLEAGKKNSPQNIWIRNMNRLRELVLHQNPREFLRWDVISDTMFISNLPFVSVELDYLKHHADWSSRFRKAIRESPVGHPSPSVYYPRSSGNLIHHAYHIAQFEEKTGSKVNNFDFVVEFGGGYGSMCRLFYNLEFCGRYVIFDLPLFSALQTYFLKTLGLPVLSKEEFSRSTTGIFCVSDLQSLNDIVAEHVGEDTLFVATWSLSESPVSLREGVFSSLLEFQSFLIAYQNKFGEVDNCEYFGKWEEMLDNIVWKSWEISHLPENYYLIGNAPKN